MIAIIVKHSYDIVQIDREDAETLREICAEGYEGDLTPWYVLDTDISDVESSTELTIVDSDGEDMWTIYDEQL